MIDVLLSSIGCEVGVSIYFVRQRFNKVGTLHSEFLEPLIGWSPLGCSYGITSALEC